MQKVFVLIWGGGNEPESPAVSVHATLAGALAAAGENFGSLFESADAVRAACEKLRQDMEWSDRNGDTFMLIEKQEVQS